MQIMGKATERTSAFGHKTGQNDDDEVQHAGDE